MKHFFSQRQRFSLRKYSFGLASVLLGAVVLSNSQTVQAEEAEDASNASNTIATTASGTADLVEEKVVTSSPELASNPVLEVQASGGQESSTLAIAVASETSQAQSETVSSRSSESAQTKSESASSSEKASDHQVATSTTDNQGSHLAPASASLLASNASATSEGLLTEGPVSSESSDKAQDKVLATDTQVSPIPLAALEQLLPSRSFARLMNSINAAAAERNRGRRGQAGTTGFRDSGFVDTENIEFKMPNVPIQKGKFVNRETIENIKIEYDLFGIPVAYQYKIRAQYLDDNGVSYTLTDGNVVDVWYRRLGTIDFVDAQGNAISGVTTSVVLNNATDSVTVNNQTFDNSFDAAITSIPTLPAGYRLKTVNGDPTKVEAYVDTLVSDTVYDFSTIDASNEKFTDVDEAARAYPAPVITNEVWNNKQKQTVTLVRQADGSLAIDPSIASNGGSVLSPATRYHLVLEADETDITKATSQTVTYTGAATNPAANVDASFTFQGKKNSLTGEETWTSKSHTYGTVTTPVISGYYADKTVAGGQTVTPDAPDATDTVTYTPLGKVIYVDEAGNQIPNSQAVTFVNDANDPTKAAITALPSLPSGYEIKDGQNLPIVRLRDGSRVANPSNPGSDIRIVVVNGQKVITKASSQTVTFTGAGSATPAADVQNDFTFSGSQDQVTGNETWNQTSHTYGTVTVQVIKGYYADKATAGGLVVTPSAPDASETVTYASLGKIIPVDEAGNPITGVSQPQYENDSTDPTKAGQTATPVITGYVTETSSVTPTDPGADTKVVYRKAAQKAVVTYLDQTTGLTLESEQLSGKSGEAITYSTAAKIQYYRDRGYDLVADEFPSSPSFDTDASLDQSWTVTLKHGTAPVGPSNPQTPGSPINPQDPTGPKWPAQDQYIKDVKATVKYVSTDASNVPADHVETAQWTRTLTLDKVTGAELSATAWVSDKSDYAAVASPLLTGYFADKAKVDTKSVTQSDLEETVTYAPLGKLSLVDEAGNLIAGPVVYKNDSTDPTKAGETSLPSIPSGYEIKSGQTIAGFDETAGTVTPANPGNDTQIVLVAKSGAISQAAKQTVSFTGAGSETPVAKEQNFTFTGTENQVTGVKTWQDASHTFTVETVPVVTGYYADKASAGGLTVTPDAPTASETVTYTKLGQIVLVDESGQPISGTLAVTYQNDGSDATKVVATALPSIPSGYEIKSGQTIAGFDETAGTVTASNLSADTLIVLVAKSGAISQAAKQTVTFTGAGSETPVAKEQNFTFTGTENQVTGVKTWQDASHTFTVETVPVVTGYYADKASAGGLTVTPDAPTASETVTYAKLGQIVLVDESGQPISGTVAVTYQNDGSDATKVVATALPSIPSGYEIKSGQTIAGFDETSGTVTPANPGNDTQIVLVTKSGAISQAAKQTVTFTGADSATPSAKEQNFTFTGTESQVTGVKTWQDASHTFTVETVPVVTGYYADKASAGGLTVTPDAPTASETVTYAKLGKIIPVDESGNPIPGAETPTYVNDPSDPTKGGVTSVPNIPGYTPKVVSVTPGKPGEDTQVVYLPIIDDLVKATKQTVTFTGAGSETPATDVQNDFVFQGKYNQANQSTTWNETSHTYASVKVPVITGYFADKASAGAQVVTPDAPEVTDTVTYKALGKIIPVDESGNPIPGVETPTYVNDPNDPTKGGETGVPTIPGYTPQIVTVIPGDPSGNTQVIYVKDTQKAIILYVNENGNVQLAKAEVLGKSGERITYSTEDQINSLKRQGYVLVSDGFTSASGQHFDLDATVDQTFTVVLAERVEPVDPNSDNPKVAEPVDPSDPNTPSWPSSVLGLDNHDDVKRTIAYVYENGRQAANDVVETLHFQRGARVNLVTGAITYDAWTTSKDNFEAVISPTIPGYTADQRQVAAVTGVTAGTEDSRVVVTFVKDIQKVLVSYLDETSGQVLSEDQLTGQSGDLISYSTADKIKEYQEKGYLLVKVDFPESANFDSDSSVDQRFTVSFKHDTVDKTETKETTATVRYISTDDKASLPADKVQTAKWTRTVTSDKVTGDVITTSTWTADKAQYDAVATPVVMGYYADKAQVATQDVTESNLETVVTYTPLGKIIPVDVNGNPIPGAETPIYVNDPNDPTKVLVTGVPIVPGYKTETKEVTPSNPGQDSKVVYVRDIPVTPTPDEDTYIVIEYRDEFGNKLRPDRIISSRQGATYDVSDGDPYIYRNGVRYEKIRQENSKGTTGKGRTTVTYIYRRVDDPAPSGVGTNRNTSGSGVASSDKATEANAQTADSTQESLPTTGESDSPLRGLGAFLLGILATLGFLRKKKNED